MQEEFEATKMQPPALQYMPGTPGIYEVAGISLDELVNNEAALKLVLHTFRQTADENTALKQQQNFDKSEIARIQQEKQNLMSSYHQETTEKTIGTGISFLATIPVGFGINLLTTSSNSASGWSCLMIGVVLAVSGLLLSIFRFWWKR